MSFPRTHGYPFYRSSQSVVYVITARIFCPRRPRVIALVKHKTAVSEDCWLVIHMYVYFVSCRPCGSLFFSLSDLCVRVFLACFSYVVFCVFLCCSCVFQWPRTAAGARRICRGLRRGRAKGPLSPSSSNREEGAAVVVVAIVVAVVVIVVVVVVVVTSRDRRVVRAYFPPALLTLRRAPLTVSTFRE